MTKLSVLNLVPIREGQTQAEAIEAMVRLAKETERLGYERYWIAEHHNTASLVSSATQILIGHTLAHVKNSCGKWRSDAAKPQPVNGCRAIWHIGNDLSKSC